MCRNRKPHVCPAICARRAGRFRTLIPRALRGVLVAAVLASPVTAGPQPAVPGGQGTPPAAQPGAPRSHRTPAAQPAAPGSLAGSQPAPEAKVAGAAAAVDEETLVTSGLVLSHAALAARADWVKTSAAIPPDTRDRALPSYDAAIQNLSTAESLERKAQAFEQARVDAPRTLAELTRELSRPTIEPEGERGVPAAELESTLRMVQADLAAARTTLAKVEGEQNKRSRRRLEAPQQVADIRAELAEIAARLRSHPPAENDEVAVAERALLLSRQQLLEASLHVCDREIASYDARGELLAAKRDQALRRVARLSERADDLDDRLTEAREQAAERDAKSALAAQREIALVHPVLGRLAERNAELASLRSGPHGLNARIQRAGAALSETRETLAHVETRFSAAREKAEAVGFTPAIGVLLRKERSELPALSERKRAMRERRTEIGVVQLRLIELEEERDALADTDAGVRDIMDAVEKVLAPSRLRVVQNTARELLLTQRGYLDSLIKDYDRYFASLLELEAREQDLAAAVRDYARYIDENVLWIRGSSIANTRMAGGVRAALAWVSRPVHIEQLADGVRATLGQGPPRVLFLLVLWGALFVYRGRMRSMLASLCPSRTRAMLMSNSQTAQAFVLVALLASIWPLLLLLGARLLDGVEGASGELGAALAGGLVSVAKVLFVGQLVRQLCKADGVCETQLGVAPARTRTARRAVASAMTFGLPALLVVATFDNQPNELLKISFGRLAFMIGMTWLATVLYRAFKPSGGVLDGTRAFKEGPWREYWLRIAHVLATAVPVGLAVLAGSGYDYAAHSINQRVGDTIALGLAVYLAYALVTRWLLIAQRRLALRQARERRAAQQQAEEKRETDGEAAFISDAGSIDLGTVNAQTRGLVRTVTIASVVIGLFFIWYDVLPALRAFERVELWEITEQTTETVQSDAGPQVRTSAHQRAITILDVMTAFVIAVVTVAGSRNIPGFLEMTVLQRLPFDAGLRYAVTTISRYLIAVIGSVLSVSALGLGWSKVQWLVAAMSVGLGFGLQEIFANFVAGLMMLFERPVRVGDMVTLGSQSGTVARIRIRATTIVDWDRKELIIPNKEFITGQLINWSLSDQILRVVVPVGIAYGSDTQLAERLLLQIAQACEYVLSDPPPTVMFSAFGESSLDFQLRVHIAQFDHMWRVRHALCMAIDKEFRKAGLEISFPQRDLHIRSVAGPIEVSVRADGEPQRRELQQTDRR